MVLNHFSHLKVESPCSKVSPSVLPWGVLQLTFSSQERRKPEFEQSLGTYLDLADLKPWLEMWPHTGCILNIYLIHWAVTPFSEGVWETAGFPGSQSEPKKCFRHCYCGLCFSVTDMCDGFVAIPIAFRFRRKVLLRLTSGRLVCPVHNTLNWVSVLSLPKLELSLLKSWCREKCTRMVLGGCAEVRLKLPSSCTTVIGWPTLLPSMALNIYVRRMGGRLKTPPHPPHTHHQLNHKIKQSKKNPKHKPRMIL